MGKLSQGTVQKPVVVVNCDLCDAKDLEHWHTCSGCIRQVCDDHEGYMQAAWPDGWYRSWYCPDCLPDAKKIHAELCQMDDEMKQRGKQLWAAFKKAHRGKIEPTKR